ncbi:MAG: 8-oxoguanine deaminase [Acidimicrobiia bacterium]
MSKYRGAPEPTLLVRHAQVLVTMGPDRREVRDGALFARDGWIEQVGPTVELAATADVVLDLSDHVVIPGLVNSHHHLYQTLTRAVPAAQDVGLFEWLTTLYPIWARMTPDDLRVSTQVGLAELAMSGCTTAFDHHYLWPNGARLDDQVGAAQEVGLRFHVSRGSMSLGESRGGLPPDSVVEEEDAILADCQRVTDAYHDPTPGAMTRVVVAPCSPFSVTPELMRESAALARDRGVRLHTHLAETVDEEAFCRERFGRRPVELAEDLGWAGEDVWYAHAVHVSNSEARRLGEAGTGVAHCPTSNMRLASGIAPLQSLRVQGVPVGLGVDGSASNDGNHLLAEARQAMLLARLASSPARRGGAGRGEGEEALFSGRQALELATSGGARVLGRDDVGSLEAGKACDFAAFRVDGLEHAGALHDPVAALLFCAPVTVDHAYVQGRAVVSHGELVALDLPRLVEQHNAAARRMARDE